jgi:hypothetical protein
MKKVIILTALLTTLTFAQWNTGAVKLGVFNPGATDAGFIIGYEGGHHFDRFLSWNWSIDWFHQNYIDKTLVSAIDQYYPGTIGEINELRAKTNIHDFPVMLGLTARFPMTKKAQFYLTGSMGAEMMLINYRNFQNPNDDSFKAAFDFDWRVGFGAAFSIGPRSELFGEISYHEANPSWTYESNDYSYPNTILERSYDMSGFMTRIGIRFFY